jgi:hypothetical protein
MPVRKFTLSASVKTANPTLIKGVLKRVIGSKGIVKRTNEGFEIHAKLEGTTARDLNRDLLSEMRRAVRKTRLRSEWSSGKTVQKFFDYASKGNRKSK